MKLELGSYTITLDETTNLLPCQLSRGSGPNIITPKLAEEQGTGRSIQTSIYGTKLSPNKWDGMSWPINAIEGGTWTGGKAPTPKPPRWTGKHWTWTIKAVDWTQGPDAPNLPTITTELSETQDGKGLKFTKRVRYPPGVRDENQRRDQEFPAVFLKRIYHRLYVARRRVASHQLGLDRAPALTPDLSTQPIYLLNDLGYGLRLAAQKYCVAHYLVGKPGEKGATSYFAPKVKIPYGVDIDYSFELYVGSFKKEVNW